jgi:hypothetical protein
MEEVGVFAVFDSILYAEKLLKEIRSDRWWRDLNQSFRPRDLGKAWKEYFNCTVQLG